MSKVTTFSEGDQALCAAVFKQIEVDTFKLDYQLLQEELSLPSVGAAKVRWSRFKSKLNGKTTPSASAKASTSESVVFTESDQALCVAIIKQVEVDTFKLDYNLVQEELSLPSVGAAKVRWSRLKSKLQGKTPVKKVPGTPKSKGTAEGRKTPTSNKRGRKKDSGETNDIGTTEKDEADKENEAGDGGEVEMPTPSRKRVKHTKVKGEELNGEGNEGEDEQKHDEASEDKKA